MHSVVVVNRVSHLSHVADQTVTMVSTRFTLCLAVAELLTIQVVGSHQQLKAELGRDFHIRHILCILHLFIVIEVFTDFLQNEAIDIIKDADVGFGFHEAI